MTLKAKDSIKVRGTMGKRYASTHSSVGGGMRSGGSSGRDGLTCPKCGDPCVHVETFVCKLN